MLVSHSCVSNFEIVSRRWEGKWANVVPVQRNTTVALKLLQTSVITDEQRVDFDDGNCD